MAMTILLLFLLLLTENWTAIHAANAHRSLFRWFQRPSTERNTNARHGPQPDVHRSLLFLDVDNTLYVEAIRGVERQILAGIHDFCRNHLSMTEAEAQDLHERHGSTIQGLMDTGRVDKRLVRRFYEEVYGNVSVSALLEVCERRDRSSTGYSHSTESAGSILLDLLMAPSKDLGVVVASNSPLYHIEKVLQALGLTRVPFQAIITPETRPGYATKARPAAFFRDYLPRRRPGPAAPPLLGLVDDSASNIRACRDHMRTFPVDHYENSLTSAVCRALGFVEAGFNLSQVDYLRAKNRVDMGSLHRGTHQRMIQEVIRGQTTRDDGELIIADLGAGLLSMLRLLLFGYDDIPSLLDAVVNGTSCPSVHYYAYESNQALEQDCFLELEEMGFDLKEKIPRENQRTEYVFVRRVDNHPPITVHLRLWDIREDIDSASPTPLLVVGCCFADLMNPSRLTRTILRKFGGSGKYDERMLVYFPITFRGITQFLPCKPFEKKANILLSIPSDTQAFACYSKALEEQYGHSLDPSRLVAAICNHGGALLESGTSDWFIDPSKDGYLWETMMYFFGTVACPVLYSTRWDAGAWIERARKNRATIHASNVDLLFSLPPIGSWKFKPNTAEVAQLSAEYFEIQFTAPGKVRFITNNSPVLRPNQVRIKSLYSLISSGTELKIFNGQFDDAALDVNIKGMETERMEYPLSYGYCLVGVVTECGSEVQDADNLVGKRVFTFSSHASQVVCDRDSVQIVPDDIDPIDAIFMPSVETALSIVHDANPRFGERVAVFGQGLIGLLVTAILSLTSGSFRGTLTTVDMIPERLAASAMMGSHESLKPRDVESAEPFDVTIEVSGNGRALQNAIDSARMGGKVILGSWYGNTVIPLKLGIEFHRSQKTLVVSQVSRIPASLRSTWDKQRRFELSWELVRQIRPSRILSRRISIDKAQQAYESLRSGEEISIAFSYEHGLSSHTS